MRTFTSELERLLGTRVAADTSGEPMRAVVVLEVRDDDLVFRVVHRAVEEVGVVVAVVVGYEGEVQLWREQLGAAVV